MFVAHGYALSLEHDLRRAFNQKDRGGFGGIADADFLESSPYAGMACALATYYNNLEQHKKAKVEDFLSEYYFYRNKSMNEIGEKDLKVMIKDFQNVINIIK